MSQPATAPLRVIHVTTTDISLALLLGPQLRAFGRAGYEVVGASAPGPFVDELADLGVAHVPLRHATRSWAPAQDARALVELYTLFRRLRPDLVHTHNPKPGIYGRVAARLARVPAVVNTVHGLYALPDDRWAKRTAVLGLERLAARCSDAELVQSREDLEVLRQAGVPVRKLHHLGNGIDLGRFHPLAVPAERAAAVRRELAGGEAEVLVGAVGRLVEEKGLPELITAAARLRALAPGVRVVVVGPDDDAKADALGADTRAAAERAGVQFAGMRQDIEAVYAALDLYVLASRREGFPRSAMEASAMGLPVVATDIRGCREVVDHGTTGMLVPVRDPGALARAVAALAADPRRRAAMGAAGAAKARRDFDDARVIEKTLAVYAALLGRQPTSGLAA